MTTSTDGQAPRERPTIRPPRIFILFCAFLLFPATAVRADTVVVRLVVNGEPKGDVFAERTPGGDFLVRASDLAAAGLRETTGAVAEIGGETYIFLRSMKGIGFSFDEKTLCLSLTAAPECGDGLLCSPESC